MTSFPEHPPAFPPVPFSEWLARVESEIGVAGLQSLRTRTEDGLSIAPLYTSGSSSAFSRAPTSTTPPSPASATPGDAPADSKPGQFPFVRGGAVRSASGSGWEIRVLRDEPDPGACAGAARDDLAGGAASVLISIVAHDAPPTRGVRIESLDELDAALEGVHLEMVGVSLDAGAHFLPAAAALVALWERRETPHEARRGELGADPLAALARHGTLHSSTSDSLAQLADLAAWTSSNLPGIRAVRVSTLPYHEAGCTPAQELGIALATGVCYLRALTDGGLSPREAAAQIVFDICVGTEQFQEIARLRALRLAWARILEECGVRDESPLLNARMSPRILTKRDPAVNMLRGTVACLSAAAGGANAVIVPPFDAALGISNSLARRVARNTHHVLGEEAGLANVVDPAGGSWFVESLTLEFAELAWRELRQIEDGGGMPEELSSGRLAQRIATARVERESAVATRTRPITGVSEFANPEEALLLRDSYGEPAVADPRPHQAGAARPGSAGGLRTGDQEASDSPGGSRTVREDPLDEATRTRTPSAEALDAVRQSRTATAHGSMTVAAVDAIREGARFGDVAVLCSRDEPASLPPLAPHRVAEPFEALRDRSDAFLQRTGARPRMFIATLGASAGFAARVAFTRNALAAGGVESRVSGELQSAVEAGTAFAESGCTAAVVAASEDVPAEIVAATARALRASGADLLIHAGRAGEREADLRDAGVSSFLHTGSNLVELLHSVHLALELDS